jgi:chromosome segregation ATPase
MSDSSGNPISYYVDDIKDSWRSLRLYIFPRNISSVDVHSDLPPPAQAPHAQLDAIAKVNEELRDRCINIVNRSEDLLALRNEFIEVFGEVGKILKNSEGTNSALMERSTMLALEAEEHSALKLRHRALHEENETNKNENSILRGEVQRNEQLVGDREARIETLETDLATEKDQAAQLRGAIEQERFMASLATEKLQAALLEVENGSALIEALQVDSVALNDRCSKAEYHARALQDSLTEALGDAKGLRDALAESQQRSDGFEQSLDGAATEIDGLRKRNDALESALSSSRLEHEMAQVLWRQRAEESRDEIAALGGQIDVHRSSAEAGEQLLAEARAELAARVGDLRAKDLYVEQLEAKIAPLNERGDQARLEIAALEARIGDEEKARARVADRAQALVRAMNDTKAKLESAEERVSLLNKRLANDSEQFAVESEQFQQRIRELTGLLEKEKNARIVLAGALEASRTKAARPRPAPSMHEILSRAEEASADEDDDYLLPWPARPTSQHSGRNGAPEQNGESLNGEGLDPVKTAGKGKLSMPKTKMLVIPRSQRRNEERHTQTSASAPFPSKREEPTARAPSGMRPR